MNSLVDLHPILQRQIRRNQIDDAVLSSEQFITLMRWISQAYYEADNDRYTIERTLEISSEEMRELYQSLEEERRVLSSVMSDGICIVDCQWNIIRINSEMERLLDISSTQAENRNLFEYLKYQIGENTYLQKKDIEKLTRETSNFHYEQGIIEKFNSQIIYATFSVNIIDQKKTTPEYLIIMHDITRQVEKENQLREAKETAERMSHIKSQFLANMSHEIRTPLNGIIGTTELLMNRSGVEPCIPYYTIIMDSSKLLLSIINDILDVTKMEYGQYTLSKSDCDFTHIFKNVMNMFGAFGSKNLKIQCGGIGTDPLWLNCDETRVKQILINLIGNAVKFTESGTIDVHVHHENIDENRIKLSISVNDTGPGIPADKLALIFDRFTQVEDSTKKRHQGTGLGLSITKNLIELMQGEIHVESTLSVGSKFYFYIIVEKGNIASHVQKTQDVIEQERPAFEKMIQALVVEDNLTNQTIIKKQLEMMHCNVTIAYDEKSTLNALNMKNYDIIFMDLHLPGTTGIELTQTIRKIEKHSSRNTPIIACTSSNESEDKAHCLEAGMNDYLAKPYFQKTLFQILKKWCENNDQTQIEPIFNNDSEENNLILRESDLQDFVNIDPTGKFIIELIDEYIKDTDESIRSLFSSSEKHDHIVCHRICHSLKSSSATLGLARVSAICKELEFDFSRTVGTCITDKINTLHREYTLAKKALHHYREKHYEKNR